MGVVKIFFAVSRQAVIKALTDTAGIENCGKGIRFYGYFIEEEKTLVIEMTSSGKEE